MERKSKSSQIPRRGFIKAGCYCSLFGLTSGSLFELFGGDKKRAKSGLNIAKYWGKNSGGSVTCVLCPNECTVLEGENGTCRSRGNRDGKLRSLSYGKPAVIASDRIEKTPLYHYEMDGKVFSLATAGCNLACQFCQNHEYSQKGPNEVKAYSLSPEEVIGRAKKNKMKGINFFYTEPVVYYEYMLDIAKIAQKEKLKTFCITAGYIHPEPLEELIPHVDAFAFGLKGFDNEFYQNYVGCKLDPIKKSLKILASHKEQTWFEIVNLLLPGLNDNPESISAMSKWLASEIGKEIPLHFTRFEPYYKLAHLAATPLKTLQKAQTIAKKAGLQHVYIGNMPGAEKANTFCPRCGKAVVERVGFKTISKKLKNGKCSCGEQIPGYWL